MVQVLLTRLGDTLPTLCWPGQFSSDPINLLSQIRLQGQTGQTVFMASFKTLVFLAALSFANVCSVPENDENYPPLRGCQIVCLSCLLKPPATRILSFLDIMLGIIIRIGQRRHQYAGTGGS